MLPWEAHITNFISFKTVLCAQLENILNYVKRIITEHISIITVCDPHFDPFFLFQRGRDEQKNSHATVPLKCLIRMRKGEVDRKTAKHSHSE
jgi:hypothetical protein